MKSFDIKLFSKNRVNSLSTRLAPPLKTVKILVAEDSAVDRLILEKILTKNGYHVILATDGEEAIALFEQESPDMVFLDVIMPRLNGMEAAKVIRKQSGDVFTPIVFLTSLVAPQSLAACLEAGGDDFLSKPYNPIVIEAKVKAFYRMREMHQTMQHQRDQIERHNQNLMQEQAIAKQVFDKINDAGALDLPVIQYYMSALAVFNGDVLLCDLSPSGSLFMLLGDFTGHGLPAAIGSMPLASIFHGMVKKGFSLGDIIRELNEKLYHTLPVGLFCCATAVDLSLTKHRALIWSGGLPDGCIYHAKNRSYTPIKSTNLPLGILANREFDHTPVRHDLDEYDRIVLWSDGILEARNASGEMFGEQRLQRILDSGLPVEAVFDSILSPVKQHLGEGIGDDDVSMVALEMPPEKQAQSLLARAPKSRGSLADWAMELKLNTSSLKTFEPLQLLLNVISEVPHLRQSSSILYTVMSELFNNAVEHGVLDLPSSLKSSPEGFNRYYTLRKERLASLQDGWVTIEFEHALQNNGGLLIIRFRDSGKGFMKSGFMKNETGDKETDNQETRDSEDKCQKGKPLKARYFGRGLKLIESLCEQINVYAPGNCVEAIFRWSTED